MEGTNSLPPAFRAQMLATFDLMGEALRTIELLAHRRGHGDEWERLVRLVIALRIRVQHGPLGLDSTLVERGVPLGCWDM